MLNLVQYLPRRDHRDTAEQLLPLAERYVTSLIYRGCIPRGVDREDLFQEARLAAVRAVRKYVPGRKSLASFVLMAIHRDIVRYVARWNRDVPQPVDPAYLSDGFGGMLQALAETEENTNVFAAIFAMLPAECTRQKQVLALLFQQGQSEQDVQRSLGLSRSTIKFLKQDGLRRLREEFSGAND